MPRYRLILIIIFILLFFFFLFRADFFKDCIKILISSQEQQAPLPEWLTRTHRLSGPYAFDYIPLDFDDLALANGDNDIQNSGTPAGSTYINPSGSPYPPGTLADMIWQQKQQDQRYRN
ncbi:MAG: hypothetical protein FJ152_09105 [Firmicutes bacterium]|nr:hypothetical protein [Bacillota bacterium]